MGEQAETKEVPAAFVLYIKERDAARAETKNALEDLRETQCRLYDAMKEIDRLEKVGTLVKLVFFTGEPIGIQTRNLWYEKQKCFINCII